MKTLTKMEAQELLGVSRDLRSLSRRIQNRSLHLAARKPITDAVIELNQIKARLDITSSGGVRTLSRRS